MFVADLRCICLSESVCNCCDIFDLIDDSQQVIYTQYFAIHLFRLELMIPIAGFHPPQPRQDLGLFGLWTKMLSRGLCGTLSRQIFILDGQMNSTQNCFIKLDPPV